MQALNELNEILNERILSSSHRANDGECGGVERPPSSRMEEHAGYYETLGVHRGARHYGQGMFN